MVEIFVVIQLTFAEIFVLQDFTIRTTTELSGPQTYVTFPSSSFLARATENTDIKELKTIAKVDRKFAHWCTTI